MLTLEETSTLLSILQANKCTFQQILDKFTATTKSESFPRVALSLRCMLEDYYTTSVATHHSQTATQCEILVVLFLIYFLSSQPHNEGEAGCLPNTKSLLYEQLQKVESLIREKRTSKADNTNTTKIDTSTTAGQAAMLARVEKEWDDEEAIRVNSVVKLFILNCVTGRVMKEETLQRTPETFLVSDMQTMDGEFLTLSKEPTLRNNLQTFQQAFETERRNAVGSFLGKGICPLVTATDTQALTSEEGSTCGGSGTIPNNSNSVAGQQQAASQQQRLGLQGAVAGGNIQQQQPQQQQAGQQANKHPLLRFEPFVDRPRPPFLSGMDIELMYLTSEGYLSEIIFNPMSSLQQGSGMVGLQLASATTPTTTTGPEFKS